jgi:hypothetical protein
MKFVLMKKQEEMAEQMRLIKVIFGTKNFLFSFQNDKMLLYKEREALFSELYRDIVYCTAGSTPPEDLPITYTYVLDGVKYNIQSANTMRTAVLTCEDATKPLVITAKDMRLAITSNTVSLGL